MLHLNEYEDLDTLLGDMRELGLSAPRVRIELKRWTIDVKNPRLNEFRPHYTMHFPKLDTNRGEITHQEILNCIKNAEITFEANPKRLTQDNLKFLYYQNQHSIQYMKISTELGSTLKDFMKALVMQFESKMEAILIIDNKIAIYQKDRIKK